jgi:serine/threonine protein kinase/tetratricopeptide (TPR) repeat protein
VDIAPRDWPRLLALIDQALDQPAAQRIAWVDGLHLDAPTGAALRALLNEREALEAGAFMSGLPTGPAHAGLVASAAGPNSGARIGPWRLVQEIGRGGMSTVWLAERADGQVQRRVALKLPHAGPGQAALAARLLRERDILASLEHPHIARLYDVGLTEAGTPYLAMEFVPGIDIVRHANTRRLTVPQRLALFEQVLQAVQHAHGKLVLHRDLKPDNILVDATGAVKLLDFGIAKPMADGAAGDDGEALTDITRAAGRQMTLAYASPEQLRGERLGTASDVYALGVVLFELLTGERPYAPASGSAAALEDAVLNAEPRRPSQAWPNARPADTFASTAPAVRRALAGDLDVIVLTALQKDPAQRYATADAMALDLQRHRASEPILARRSSRAVRLRKFLARHAASVGAGAAVFTALAVGLGAALWQGAQTRLEATKATAMKDFLVTLLRGNDIERVDESARRELTLQAVLQQSAAQLTTGLKDQPEVRDELRVMVADLLDNLDLLESSIPLRQQHANDLAARGAPVPEQARALRDLAESQNSRLDKALATLRVASALCRAARAEDARSSACLLARVEHGRLLVSLGDMAAGAAEIEDAAPPLIALPVQTLDRAIAIRSMAELRSVQGQHDQADVLHQRALADFETVWGPRSPRLSAELQLRANALALQQRFASAIEVYRRAWDSRVLAVGPAAVSSAKLELEMGLLMYRVGQDASGETHVLHASEVMKAASGPERPQLVFDACRARAELAVYSGRLGAANEALDALDAASKALELNASDAAERDVLRATHHLRTGRFTDALQLFERRRETAEHQQGPDASIVAVLDRRRLDALIAAGRLDAAEKLAMAAGPSAVAEVQLARGNVEAAWPALQTRHAQMAARPRSDQYLLRFVQTNESMGIALAALGRPREALIHFQAAIEAQAAGYAHSPPLAALRARAAGVLVALNDTDAAQVQVRLARAALDAEPLAGPQFRRPVEEAEQQLRKALKKV